MNDKVYWFTGWTLKEIQGIVVGFVPGFWGIEAEAKAIVRITKSESKSYKVGDYVAVNLCELHYIA